MSSPAVMDIPCRIRLLELSYNLKDQIVAVKRLFMKGKPGVFYTGDIQQIGNQPIQLGNLFAGFMEKLCDLWVRCFPLRQLEESAERCQGRFKFMTRQAYKFIFFRIK